MLSNSVPEAGGEELLHANNVRNRRQRPNGHCSGVTKPPSRFSDSLQYQVPQPLDVERVLPEELGQGQTDGRYHCVISLSCSRESTFLLAAEPSGA